MVTTHVSALTKSAAGSNEKLIGPPEAAAECGPLSEQVIVNHMPLTFTGSLKATETLASSDTPLAPADGVVVLTAGAWSLQLPGGDAEVRGAGAAAVKSAPLLSVSTQPLPARNAAVPLLSVGAGAAPSKKLAPS